MNGDIFLNPYNKTRHFFALNVGWNEYDNWNDLTGAVSDAKSIHHQLEMLGYDARILENPFLEQLERAIDDLINSATAVCQRPNTTAPPKYGTRGAILVDELAPCQNTVLFIYFSGHGFAKDGVDYIVSREAQFPPTPEATVNVNALKARLAEAAAIQIIIADVSRGIVGDE